MADNSVFVAGISDSIPQWATEDTLSDIKAILAKSYLQDKNMLQAIKNLGTSRGSAGAAGPSNVADLEDEFEKLIKEFSKLNNEAKKSSANWGRQEKDLKKRKSLEDLMGAKTAWVANNLVKFGNTIKNVYSENVRVYGELNAQGVNLVAGLENSTSGFNALQQLTQITGVRFTELQAVMTKYGTAVNAFSAGKFAKTVSQSSLELRKFGFSTKESAELLGAYLESQMVVGDVRSKSEAEVSKDLVKFGERINVMSLTMGMSRQALLENIEAISKSNEASILQGQVGTDAANSTLQFIASIKNKQLGAALLKMMTDPIKPLNQTFMAFQKLGLGGLGMKLMNFQNSIKGLDPKLQADLTKEWITSHKDELAFAQQRANLLGYAGSSLGGESQAVSTIITGLQELGSGIAEVKSGDLAKLEKTNEARAALLSEWEKMQSSFQAAFAPTPELLKTFASGLEEVNGVIKKIIDGTSDSSRNMVGIAAAIGGTLLGILLPLRLFAASSATVATAASASAGIFTTAVSAIGGAFASFGSLLARAGLALLGLINPVTATIAAIAGVGLAGYGIYKYFKKEEAPAPAPGMGSRESAGKISIAKEPVATTINSPSRVSTTPAVDGEQQAQPAEKTKATTTGIEKPVLDTGINSMLGYQSSLLEQILQSTQNLVSVNKDILKYARVNT